MAATETKTVESIVHPLIGNKSHLVVPIAIIAILCVIIIPLPTFMMDLLIASNMTLSFLVLMVSIYVGKTLDLSVYPSLLLLLTLFRLALNVASTRLILLYGEEGTQAAGEIIQAFGQFMVGGNYIVGIIVFLVILVVQYLVINTGSGRISEVTARFTLDAMPGKQMAIDADLNAGFIDEKEARSRREKIAHEADFYGSMDGAIKFVQKDAVANVVIILINIIGGFLIGILQKGMTMTDALQIYTILTIGDGLVTAIPSLLISISGGMLTTRASTQDQTLGQAVSNQLFTMRSPISLASGMIFLIGMIPGFPKLAFWLLAGVAGFIAYALKKAATVQVEEAKAAAAGEAPPPPIEKVESLLHLDSLSVEIGFGLISLVDPNQGGDFLQRVKIIRRQLAQELGIIVPPIHVVDNLQLNPREYAILLRGVQIAKGELLQNQLLAVNSGAAQEGLAGIDTKDPAFNMEAKWIQPVEKEKAIVLGYAVVDAPTVLATHLTEVIKTYAHELLGRQETKALIDTINETHPKVVEELIPKLMSVGDVQKILQSLLREGVSIRDLVTILETLADYSSMTKNPILLTEYVRQAMARTIAGAYINESGELLAFTLSPDLDQAISQAVSHNELMSVWNPDPRFAKELLAKIRNIIAPGADASGVLICSSNSRPHVRQLVAPYMPKLAVLSHNEIPITTRFISLGMVK